MASNESGKLKIEQLGTLHSVLAPVAYAYKRFGSQIQVENHILLGIEQTNSDFSEKLYKVLEYRLRKLPLLTWHDIVRALRSPAVHEEVLASEIESQYIPCSSSQSQPVSPQSSTYSVMQEVGTEHSLPHHHLSVESRSLRRSYAVFTSGVDPENLVKVLYSNFLLTREEKDKAMKESLTDGQKLQEIFKAMERRVSVQPSAFHTLLKALAEEPATEEVAIRMKGKICLIPYAMIVVENLVYI